MSRFSTHLKNNSQVGMVSIMTTVILMTVIGLIILGFAQVSRRTQRESLDRQLSTQAFYAAETGINDVMKLVRDASQAGTSIPAKTSCTDNGPDNFYSSLASQSVLDAQRDIKYTCVMIESAPSELRYDDVGNDSIVVPMVSGSPITSIKLTWRPVNRGAHDADASCPSNADPHQVDNLFTAVNGSNRWICDHGVMRFDLVPTAGELTMDGLMNSAMTTFAVPFGRSGGNPTGVSDIPYLPGSRNVNNSIGTSCNADQCSLTITGLSSTSYHMRIRSIYRKSNLTITAQSASGVTSFSGSQIAVDVTGKAQDVLRRIRVNIPVTTTASSADASGVPDYAIETTYDLCKKFSVMDTYFYRDSTGTGTSPSYTCSEPN